MSGEQLFEYAKFILWIIFGSGIVLEITPLKISPVSSLLKWIGRKLNGAVREDISQLEGKVDDIQVDLQHHIIGDQRRDILAFATELMRGEPKTKEHFDRIIKVHDDYEVYLKKNNESNGQVSLAFNYISERYQECIRNNDFL